MSSRAFAVGVAAALLGLPFCPVGTQMPATVPRVGVLSSTGPTVHEPLPEGLEELGWASSRNLVFEIRAPDRQLNRLPALASELVRSDSPARGS